MKKKIIVLLMLVLIVSVNYYTIAFAKNKVETEGEKENVKLNVYRLKHVLYVDYKKAAESFDLEELKEMAYGKEDDKDILLKGTITNICFKSELVKDGELMEPNKELIDSIKKYKIIDKYDEKSSNIYRKEYINGMLSSSSLIESDSAKDSFTNPTKKGILTSKFGSRWGRMHNGIDIGLDYGDNIYASKSGKVEFAGYKGGYGNSVYINHGDDVYTRYAHTSSVLVKEGDVVNKGDLIAKAGSTGFSTGVHLHFEILIDKKPVDPLKFVKY